MPHHASNAPTCRPLSAEERRCIERFADELRGHERAQLLADAASATAVDVTPDGTRVLFAIADHDRPAYRGQHLYGVEGTLRDLDGGALSVLLYADEHSRLLELEIIRWDEGPLLQPQWDTLIVIA